MSRTGSSKPSMRSPLASQGVAPRAPSWRILMTNKTDYKSLSNIELLVLGRLSGDKAITEGELTKTLSAIVPPKAPRTVREHAQEALAGLRRRSFAMKD